jgi:hypothetical protein
MPSKLFAFVEFLLLGTIYRAFEIVVSFKMLQKGFLILVHHLSFYFLIAANTDVSERCFVLRVFKKPRKCIFTGDAWARPIIGPIMPKVNMLQ